MCALLVTGGAALAEETSEIQSTAAAESVAAEEPADAYEVDLDNMTEKEKDEYFSRLETITVTANRRAEDLQKAAVSVTALGGDFVEQMGLTDFKEISKFTPNMQIFQQSDSRSTSIRIRGIGSIGVNAGIDPSVGVFIDGVYQGRAGMSVMDLLDIQSVEVLRGPQGTLYGKNTAAGALKVTSRTPDHDPSAMFELVGANAYTFEARGAMNIPLVQDVLSTRFAGYGVRRDGYETNVSPNLAGENINDTMRWGIRNSTLWEPTDDFSLMIRGDFARVDEKCCAGDTWQYGEAVGGILPSHTSFAEEQGVTLVPAVKGDRKVTVNVNPENFVQVGGASLEATLERWDHTFTSLTAYRTYQTDSFFDADFSQLDALDWVTAVDLDQVSSELRVASPEFQLMDYVGGLYFFYSQMQTDDTLGFTANYTRVWYNCQLTDEECRSGNTGDNNHRTTSVAGFADTNVKLSEIWGNEPKISLTGGVRVGWEEKAHVGSQKARGQFSELLCPQPWLVPPDRGNLFCLETPISGLDSFSDQSEDESYVTGRIITKWEPTDDVMFYVSYATGYKSGGYNQLRTQGQGEDPTKLYFGPEHSANTEGGFRTSWFNRTVTFNVTGYYTDYEDFQAMVFDGLGIRVVNAGRFETYGAEADMTIQPVDDWITNLAVGYTKTNYIDFPQGPCTQPEAAVDPECEKDLSGQPLDNTPEWDITLVSSYQKNVPLLDVDWFVLGDYNFQSERFLNASLDPVLETGPTHILGFRTGVRHPASLWELTFWVKNALNDDYWAAGFDVPTMGGYAGFLTPPRTYGATLRMRF